MGWTISPLGDRALVAELAEGLEEGGCQRMAAAAESLRHRSAAWIVDVVPAYATVTIVYDPIIAGRSGMPAYAFARQELLRMLEAALAARNEASRLIEVPVCYGGSFGPDLEASAARSGMDAADFVQAHASAQYTVALVGFVPGFPYMAGLPAPLSQPRRSSPRPFVPAGSVGIAGGQAGIYPLAVPGGWQLIGRTPLRLFDPAREEPALLRAGDLVRFVPISEREYERLEAEARAASAALQHSVDCSRSSLNGAGIGEDAG